MAKRPPKTTTAAPAPAGPAGAELTGRQVGHVQSFAFGGFEFPAPPPGDYDTYRAMRTNPTIALARAAATAPIKGASWSWKADDDAPPDAVQLLQDSVDPLWTSIVRTCLFALDYGWQSAELVWKEHAGAWVLGKFKPLLPELTTIVVTQTGEFNGLRQGSVTLERSRCFLMSNDVEGDDWYGRARSENVRCAWNEYVTTAKRNAQYFQKAAGVIPMVTHPGGVSPTQSGDRPNHLIAAEVLKNLSSGAGITMPRVLAPWAEAAVARGVDPSQLMAWTISFLETKSGHGAEFLEAMRYLDSLMMRGWLVPERVALEGQHGTLAEAGAHADIAIAAAQETLDEIIRAINSQIVEPTMAFNYGPQYAKKVRAEAAPIVDADRQFLRNLISQVLTQPGNLDLMLSTLDLDAALDQAGVPKLTETVNQEALKTTPTANPADPNAPASDPAAPHGTQPQGPGNPAPAHDSPLSAAIARRSGGLR